MKIIQPIFTLFFHIEKVNERVEKYLELDSESSAALEWSRSGIEVLSPETEELFNSKRFHGDVTDMLEAVVFAEVHESVIDV